jgi:peptide/nickel transport system substrate-binding protein
MRVEAVDIVAEEGLPIGSDWVNLSFAPTIDVPTDAWAGWDPVAQRFLTVGEVYTQPITARSKCTVYYPADMYDTVKWHDGSPISAADFVLSMILQFDRGLPESPIYDESYAPDLASFLSHFKAFQVVSTDPLVIDTYDDYWSLDAEYMIWSWWPYYDYGIASWHALVPGLMAEADNALAFSSDKADTLEIEWTSYIAGPSIEILNSYLVSATADLYVPYAPTLGEYVTEQEVADRYTNLAEWVRTKGHFWVGNGPMYLERAFPLEGTVLLRRFLDYPDMADRWDRFAEARVATVDVSGADSVTIGKEATFDIELTFQGAAYPMADVELVKYLLIDAKGQLAYVGEAEAVEDGLWVATVPADVTANLEAGSNRIEIAVVLKPVALPAFGSMQFVTAP